MNEDSRIKELEKRIAELEGRVGPPRTLGDTLLRGAGLLLAGWVALWALAFLCSVAFALLCWIF